MLGDNAVKNFVHVRSSMRAKSRGQIWEFDPTHKIVLATNHRPAVQGADFAIWRRVRLVPFNVTVTVGEPLYGTESYAEFVSKLERAMTLLAAEEKLPAWE